MNLDSAIFYTKDLEAAIDFYQALGLKVESQDGVFYASFGFPNGAKLGIKSADEDREVPGHQTVVILVDNIDQLNSELKDKGHKYYRELTEYDWGRTFSILDPDGNKVEFLQK